MNTEKKSTIEILNNCINAKIKNIYVTGYSEVRNDFNFFSPMFWWYYLEFKDYFLCLDTSDETKEMQIFISQKIQCNFDIEEEDIFTITSVNKETSSEIADFDIFTAKYSSNIVALGILFKDEKYVFFDSLNWDGIIIGDIKNKLNYLEDDRFYMENLPR